MAGRRVNQALLGLIFAAVASGWLAFALGTSIGGAVVIAHGVAGLALVLLAPWKKLIVRRGLKRARPGRATSIALAVLTAVAVGTGVAMAVTGLRAIGPLTAMQAHVGSAMLALVVAAAHVARRGAGGRPTDIDRRDFLRVSGLAAGATGAWLALEGVGRIFGLAGADRRFTGSHERGSGNPAGMPTTQWIDDPVPRVDRDEWSLRIVDAQGARIVGYGDLDHHDTVTAVLDCTGGWWAEQRWTGTRLDRLVAADGLESFVVVSHTGYRRRFPLRDAPSMLLATGIEGEPLSPGHGFPARIVAPGRRGFWWVKWVVEIRADERPWWWQSPFPVT